MRNKGGLRVSLKLYAKNTYTIMKNINFGGFYMNTEIIEIIEKEIIDTLLKMKDMEPGSKEREDAMKYVSDLYDTLNSERKCLVDSRKVDNDEDRNKFDKLISIGKLGIELFGVAGPLMFYNSWMKKGFEFEKTGMITSQTFRGLIGKFKPSR